MHSYSINSKKREEVTKIITILSFAIGVIFAVVEVALATLDIFRMQAENVIWILLAQIITTLFPITLYEVLTYFYRNVLWKKLIFYHKIPDLNGIWEGELRSPLKDTIRTITIEIKQDWDSIKINTYTNKRANAMSTLAEIRVDDVEKVYLSYAFENIRVKGSYIGFNRLTYKDEELFGEYFTSKTMGKEICETLGVYESQMKKAIAEGMGSKGTLRVRRKEVK